MVSSCSLPILSRRSGDARDGGFADARAPQNQRRTFADDDKVVGLDVAEAEAISDADEVELMLRALNAMVPVPKRRRTRDRLPDAEDDVARGREKEGGREERETGERGKDGFTRNLVKSHVVPAPPKKK